ncbi:hypothetical protein VSO76_21665 [Klebsiella pneumoniae]|uniref:hypothetical protein n=1 Tax=Klebsiella pneumoniae TaxID=573 RepID=UPI00164B9BC2|nr:hypothetical protein [Klebsiella pneumoniae]MBC3838503.1 hypothetical protein [Klebsiella pneumoniae]MDP0896587.1 hypothetical protein [Klebsiella pneumoniae]MEC4058844.1 hypothetical protein [Klebsiella pneumoniae]
MSTVILSGCNIFQSLKNTFVNSKTIQINNSNDNSHYGKENIPSFFSRLITRWSMIFLNIISAASNNILNNRAM